jgi:hypothetical protein
LDESFPHGLKTSSSGFSVVDEDCLQLFAINYPGSKLKYLFETVRGQYVRHILDVSELNDLYNTSISSALLASRA